MLNPLDEQRPLSQVEILGLIYVGENFAQRTMGSTLGLVITVVTILFLPASMAILGLERNVFKAAYLGLGVHGVGSNVRPRARDCCRLRITYSLVGAVGTLVINANHHIHALHSFDIQRSRWRAARAASRVGAGNVGLVRIHRETPTRARSARQ
jgi:hypothetical protein